MMNLASTKLSGIIFVGCSILSACSGGGGGGGGTNPPPSGGAPPMLSVNDVTVAEGGSGPVGPGLNFPFTLSSAASSAVTVDYTVSAGSAIAIEDYVDISNTLTIPAGSTSAMVVVELVDDLCFETDETITLNLSNISSNATLGTSTATGTITNDDNPAQITVTDATVLEGNSGTSNLQFNLVLDRAECTDISFNYATNNATAMAGDDYVANNGSLTIPAGDNAASIIVAVNGDNNFEIDETLTLNISNLSTNAEAVRAQGFGTIENDDFPRLSLSGGSVEEGDSGTTNILFTASLEAIASSDVSVDFTTLDGSATVADNDYLAATGSLTIPQGQFDANFAVTVNGDTNIETNENFSAQLSNLSGDAVFFLASASATIIDDDSTVPPAQTEVVVRSATIGEGDTGTTLMRFLVEVFPAALAEEISFNYATADEIPADSGSAEAGVDYVAASGAVTIPANEFLTYIDVDVLNDSLEEEDETFNLNLSNISSNAILRNVSVTGRINDNDGPPGPPRLSVSNASVLEGDQGQSSMDFGISLSAISSTDVVVDFTTVDGTAVAIAGNDYIPNAGSITIPAGEIETVVSVQVIGDTVIEANEKFYLALSNLSGDAQLNDDTGVGTILTDDPLARVSIADAGILEGNAGQQDLVFKISMNFVADDDVTVDVSTQDDTALATEDYIAVLTTATIAAGNTETTVNVPILGDTDSESDERFFVLLSNLTENASLVDGQATGTILNDDTNPGWQVPAVLDNDPREAQFPQFEMNRNGNAAAIWRAGTTALGDVYASYYNATTGWTSIEPMTSFPVRPESIDITINNNDDVIAVWNTSGVHVRHFNPATNWDPAIDIDPAHNLTKEARIDNNDDNVAALVTRNDLTGSPPYDEVYASIYDPANVVWNTPLELLDDEDVHAVFPETTVDRNGNIFAVWTQTSPHVSRYPSEVGPWSAPHTLTEEVLPGVFESGVFPTVVTDRDGNAFVAWHRTLSGKAGRAKVSRYDVSSDSWDAVPFVLNNSSNRLAKWPQIEFDGLGNAWAVWLEDDNSAGSFTASYDIWSRKYLVDPITGIGTWQPAQLVNDANIQWELSTPEVEYPKLAMADIDHAIIVWSQEVGTENIVRASVYDPDTDAWNPPDLINDAVITDASNPQVDMDAMGNAMVIWHQLNPDTGLFEIWTNRYISPDPLH